MPPVGSNFASATCPIPRCHRRCEPRRRRRRRWQVATVGGDHASEDVGGPRRSRAKRPPGRGISTFGRAGDGESRRAIRLAPRARAKRRRLGVHHQVEVTHLVAMAPPRGGRRGARGRVVRARDPELIPGADRERRSQKSAAAAFAIPPQVESLEELRVARVAAEQARGRRHRRVQSRRRAADAAAAVRDGVVLFGDPLARSCCTPPPRACAPGTPPSRGRARGLGTRTPRGASRRRSSTSCAPSRASRRGGGRSPARRPSPRPRGRGRPARGAR